MTKYLDSKGLSYLWQKIKAELALKSDNHEHPYVKDDTVIKIGTNDTVGVSLVKATVEGQKDSWTIPFATVETVTKEYDGQPVTESHIKNGIVRSGDITFKVPTSADKTWHKAPIVDGYVWYEDTLADPNTVTSENGGNLTLNKVVLGAGDKKVKVSTFEIGAESYAEPAAFGGKGLLATEAAVKEYVDDVAGGVTSGLELTYTEGEGDYTGKKVIKLTDTNNKSLKVQLDATPFIKDGMLDSVEILKMHVTKGEGADDLKQWKKIDGTTVQFDDLISAPTKDATDGSIWMYFVWKTVSHNPNDVEGEFPPKTATWLPATDLINDCSADSKRGIGTDTNTDGGHLYYVKTTGIEEGKTANVSTGFDKDGKVVGYVDLSAYQKSADLVAFDKDDMDVIFAVAEADLTANKGVPTFPTTDPLTVVLGPEHGESVSPDE